MDKLQKKYESVCSEYIKKFEKKHDLYFEYWAGDVVGGIACFGDIFFFNFGDIVWDINSNQPDRLIIEWMYDVIDNPTKSINYYSYSKGLRYEMLDKN